MKLKMVGDPEIFLCPLHADEYSVYRPEATAVYWKTDHTSHKQNSRFWGSYMMNARTWTTNNEPRRREDFSSNHFLLVEEHEMDSQFNDGAIEPIAQDKIATRHEGKGYIACMDGHVIEMTSTEFDATKSDLSKYWEP